MLDTRSQPSTPSPAGSTEAPGPGDKVTPEKVTPELVRQVAEKVYQMLLAELRIEQERRRIKAAGSGGGPRRLR